MKKHKSKKVTMQDLRIRINELVQENLNLREMLNKLPVIDKDLVMGLLQCIHTAKGGAARFGRIEGR
jgi:hypothetical protein